MSRSEAYTEALFYQREAAFPMASRLVSANAGSGKTKVLVDRVSRLLYEEADPGKILCLTYTKAAASEMQARLFETLGEWSILPEGELNAKLSDLFGQDRTRNTDELRRARQLFAKALETPEGLKIQTIHAFCESVLGRFPLEAGITPGYEPLDDAERLEIEANVRQLLLSRAQAAPQSELALAISYIASRFANQTFDDWLTNIMHVGDGIRLWVNNGGVSGLARHLDIDPAKGAEQVKAEIWTNGPLEDIRHAAQSLLSSSNPNDRLKAERILTLFDLAPSEAVDQYLPLVLTKDMNIRKGGFVTTKAPGLAQEFFGWSKRPDSDEAQRLSAAANLIKAAHCLDLNRAIYVLAEAFHQEYTYAKRRLRRLDYNDQVALVRRLLVRSDVSDWVRYKLDGGIEHILIDEAQDTSPDQWDIVDALREGFIEMDSGELTEEITKTFFAVGDEKQSIYSFQGARPKIFLDKIDQFLSDKQESAIRLRMSFRSSQDILDFVDTVFSGDDAARMFQTRDDEGPRIQHIARRALPGQVELWPLSPRPEVTPEEIPWDPRPLDLPDQSGSVEKLARAIAQSVRQWIDERAPVNVMKRMGDEWTEFTRPMTAGDVLILVRQRNAFFDAVIRNLKLEGVPVAGADRLVLKDAIAVQDFMALTRFVLLPSDDLSLAEVLKSPLVGLSEDELFALAHGRGAQSFWAVLGGSTQDYAKRAHAFLSRCQAYASKLAPFEFYARVLDDLDEQGASTRARIFKRLGHEAEDAIDAFLTQALAHQRLQAPSLQRFMRDFQNGSQDIKRELDNSGGEVRVMTVHGAKGLQAPVVILPDTSQTPRLSLSGQLIPFDNGYVALPKKDQIPQKLQSFADKKAQDATEEYMRLFYVALTRAESRLVICGFESGHRNGSGMSKGCWYEHAARVMESLGTHEVDTPFGKARAFGSLLVAQTDANLPITPSSIPLPDWMSDSATEESPTARRLTPSHLLSDVSDHSVPTRSPGSQSQDRFQRGNIIHKLLELLPDIALGERSEAARQYLGKFQNLREQQRTEIFEEVFRVLDHPDFNHIFAPGSRAEVNLAGHAKGLPDHIFLNAQIDRLSVVGEEVFIVDYKSNRPPPKELSQVPQIYWGQMAAYREMVRDIYPGKTVRCALLWTDEPRLMELDRAGLDAALTRIRSLPT